MAILAMSTIETEYTHFSEAMDATRNGKSELVGVLTALIGEAQATTDEERIALGKVIAGMLCRYKGSFEMVLRGSPEYATSNKALSNAVSYVRTQAMSLINADAKKEGFDKVKISGFTNRPKGDDYTYKMDVSLAEPKSETKTEIPVEDGTVEDSIAAMDVSLDDMMQAVVAKYKMEDVANWFLKNSAH